MVHALSSFFSLAVDPWDLNSFQNTKEMVQKLLCLSEDFEGVAEKLKEEKINQLIVFFGSARIEEESRVMKEVEKIKAEIQKNPADKSTLQRKLTCARQRLKMSQFYADAQELSYRLTEWSLKIAKPEEQFFICSGGGPGIMEASNKGAYEAKGKSVGLSIDIPFEQLPNLYITPSLEFKFNTFLLRKFWFFYLVRAIVVFPGGLGTLDELFEILTLLKTKKVRRKIPILLYGSHYWKSVINFHHMVDYGTVSEEELGFFSYCDTVDEAYARITKELEKLYFQLENFVE